VESETKRGIDCLIPHQIEKLGNCDYFCFLLRFRCLIPSKLSPESNKPKPGEDSKGTAVKLVVSVAASKDTSPP
jgi:hypothetical protein